MIIERSNKFLWYLLSLGKEFSYLYDFFAFSHTRLRLWKTDCLKILKTNQLYYWIQKKLCRRCKLGANKLFEGQLKNYSMKDFKLSHSYIDFGYLDNFDDLMKARQIWSTFQAIILSFKAVTKVLKRYCIQKDTEILVGIFC